jgi:TetR/AcrR family transcriptional regulator, lmrAB and yxaGH operons repressor
LSTRDRIVDATIIAMRSSGLAGASLGRVVATSRAPKGSVYHYFPLGKEQMVGEALAAYSARVRDYVEATLSQGGGPAAKVRALFGAVARRLESTHFRESCAAGAVSLDLGEGDDALGAAVAGHFADWIQLIGRHFAIPDESRRRSFAGLLLTAIEGGYVRGRAERSPRALLEAGEWLAALAEGAVEPAR